jgi:hypothetical protein
MSHSTHLSIFRLFLIIAISNYCFRALGEDGIRIAGTYTFAYSNGRPTETSEYSFVALGDRQTWQIAVINIAQSKEWGVLEADPFRLYTISSDTANAYKVSGYVYPGTFYTPAAPRNSVKLHLPWMVFCMSPKVLQDCQKVHGFDIPSPWSARHSLVDFGLRWNVQYDQASNIVLAVTATRDPSLDLPSDEDELRRANIDYVYDYGPREHRISTIALRKGLRRGFVRTAYSCANIVFTNGFIFPRYATLDQYWPEYRRSNSPPRIVFKMALNVESFEIVPNLRIIPLKPQQAITVNDYRFQKQNDRTKYNYAPYLLESGADLPAMNDAKILKEIDEWFATGPTFTTMSSRRRLILIGISTLVTCLGALLIIRLVKAAKQKR